MATQEQIKSDEAKMLMDFELALAAAGNVCTEVDFTVIISGVGVKQYHIYMIGDAATIVKKCGNWQQCKTRAAITGFTLYQNNDEGRLDKYIQFHSSMGPMTIFEVGRSFKASKICLGLC